METGCYKHSPVGGAGKQGILPSKGDFASRGSGDGREATRILVATIRVWKLPPLSNTEFPRDTTHLNV